MKKTNFIKLNCSSALRAAALVGGATFATVAVSPAMAQAAEEETANKDEEIVVTGSRIQRRDLDSAAPVTVVGAEEFALSGTVNVENVVNSLPQVIPGTTGFSNNPGGGVATLNLRGLGDSRTMVLVNGRRWMFYDVSQVTDLNTVPSFLLESVDVVTGGASAVYGSDAMAGVVNFRLKDDLNGVMAGGQYSLTEKGDGARYNAYVAVGGEFAEDKGHATVYAEYYKREPIFQGARAFSEFAKGDDGAGGLTNGGSSTLPGGVLRYFGGAQGTGPQRLRDDPDTPEVEPTDNGIGDFFNNNAVVFDSAGVFRPRAGDLYNYAPANYLQVAQERYLVGGYADYDIGGGNEVYLEATFVNNRVPNELAATPVTGDFAINLAAVQPFLSAADFATLQAIDAEETVRNTANGDVDDAGNVTMFVQRRVTETGSRNTLDERNAIRALVGVRGPITENFSYDLYYSYARTRNSNVQAGNVSQSAFAAGLDGTGTPINIFGPNTLTPAMVDQISILAQNSDVSSLQVASGVVSGTLGNFGWGGDDIGIAVGAEYRAVSSQFIPDTALSSGDVIGFNGGLPTAGSYNAKELFAEVRLPIAGGMPGIEDLSLTGAVRMSDYSLPAVGTVWAYAGGVEYSPFADLKLRGQYQRAVRAPNVSELFGGNSNGFPGATDPCAQAAASTNPTVRALCVQTGVPAGLVGNAGIQLNTQIEALFGGNPNLQEETSDSYTFGAVLRPQFIPGLSLTVDYYSISVKGSIDSLGGGLNNTLNLCYNVIQDINSPYCQAINRNPINGVISAPFLPEILQANTGKLETSGIDLQVDFSTPVGFGLWGEESRLNFNFVGTYLMKFDKTLVADLPDEIIECDGRFGLLACSEPNPKWKWASRLSFVDGPITTSFRWRHLSSVRDDDDDTDYSVETVGAYDVFDLTFAAEIADTVTLTMGVSNLFDVSPQLIGDNQQQANTYPGTYDVLGRDYFVAVDFKF